MQSIWHIHSTGNEPTSNTIPPATLSTTPPHQDGICSFITLPPELRVEVYRYLLVTGSFIRICRIKAKNSHHGRSFVKARSQIFGHAILSTNRLLHEEAAEVLYSENRFGFVNSKVFSTFVKGIKSHSSLLRHLKISNVTTRTPIQLFKASSPIYALKSLRLDLSTVEECRIENLFQTLLPLLTKSGTARCRCQATRGRMCLCRTGEHRRMFEMIELSAWVAEVKDGVKQFPQGHLESKGDKPLLREGTPEDIAIIRAQLEWIWGELTRKQ
ncbi:Glycosylphosphatidylinositol (GPI) anchor assembly protein [Elasticomyces elasticus]|nr:Glycosylphosphatidylinositol (GPI) anchor assembly protein [Elasticomyces elasticus]KAK3664445.1 Glycosylphosphatidylinositol (GPI) anchor assembly protein [Elasticomyces elasticus]KAK4919448.1 Glycosylphosphatidylinositol (GPI) anchor assembly protein [Elasticomyces elasticus]KAK5758321.1 Glycosylphosphatidylinositol (GPI) anchor assembly protein [Elasticomyces elasticus]